MNQKKLEVLHQHHKKQISDQIIKPEGKKITSFFFKDFIYFDRESERAGE